MRLRLDHLIVRALLWAIFILAACLSVRAGDDEVFVWRAFTSSVVASNSAATSTVFNVQSHRPVGLYAAQIEVSGPGTLTNLALEASVDGMNFDRPMLSTGSRMGYLASSFATNSGANSDGKDVIQFAPPIARFYRLTVSEAAVGAATVTVHVAVQ